jgi:hypothetical protein
VNQGGKDREQEAWEGNREAAVRTREERTGNRRKGGEREAAVGTREERTENRRHGRGTGRQRWGPVRKGQGTGGMGGEQGGSGGDQ